MMKRADRLAIPLLAGSTLATCWRRPNLEYDLGEHELAEACCLCNGGVSFGFGGEKANCCFGFEFPFMFVPSLSWQITVFHMYVT